MRLDIRPIMGASLLVLMGVPGALRAQGTTGTIYGTVVDQSRSVLPGATIQVKNVENGSTRTLTTDARGQYRALDLPPGLYSVSADLQGFGSAKRENLTVEIGREVVADLTMKVGGLSEVVTVQGTASNIDLRSAV